MIIDEFVVVIILIIGNLNREIRGEFYQIAFFPNTGCSQMIFKSVLILPGRGRGFFF